ncbi:MAG TPA: cupin domain-containing protein [Spirochaetia bacterium]|nr:cupin domain-containing protein [Spirochaetia bacterium]
MFIENVRNIKSEVVTAAGANNVTRQILISPEQGWQGWVMRLFTIGAGGHSNRHSHPWPHIVHVNGGEGTIFLDGKDYPVEPGSVANIPGGLEHQFTNCGQTEFSFICVVPEEGNV